MKHLYYVLTARCNQRCQICPRSEEERVKDRDYEENLRKLERTILENQITDITVSGGEPTVYGDLARVLGLLDRLKVQVSILSNSMRLENWGYAEQVFGGIVHKENFQLVTAVHSLNPAIHDQLTGVAASQERSVRGLRKVCEMGLPVTVKCVIGRHNVSELAGYPAWVREHVSADADLLFCSMDYVGMTREQVERYRIDFSEVKKQLEAALDVVPASGLKGQVRLAEIPLCAVDPYYWSFCIGPVRKDGVYDDAHWERSAVSVPDIAPMAEKCKGCVAKKYCYGIWRKQYEEYGEAAVTPYLPAEPETSL